MIIEEVCKKPVEDLRLEEWIVKVLKRHHLLDVGDLHIAYMKGRLRNMPGLGSRAVCRIEEALGREGLEIDLGKRNGDKWLNFQDASYTLEDLGRPATFLIPSHKLRIKMGSHTVEEELHEFLFRLTSAFTTTFPSGSIRKNPGNGTVEYDECREYRVALLGSDRIKPLLRKLAQIAKAIDEKCIHFEAGQSSCLIYPK